MKPTIEEVEATPVQFGDDRLPRKFWMNAVQQSVPELAAPDMQPECWIWTSPTHDVDTVRRLVWGELSPHEPTRIEQVCGTGDCFALAHMYEADD